MKSKIPPQTNACARSEGAGARVEKATLRSRCIPWTTALTCLLVLKAAHADTADEYVQRQMLMQHLPGVALAVNQAGKTIKLAAYGMANLELQVPVTTRSVFQMQSVTKQFTATAIMLLASEGKVDLDAKVSAYLEGSPEAWNEITVRRLLNQTSGIKDFINEPTANIRLEASEKDIFDSLVARPLHFKPGEKYAYSNSNYHLLAMIIRKVTGEFYGDFLKKRIFAPLQMQQTRIISWSDLIPNRVAGYLLRDNRYQNGEFVAESILAYGGGGIASTVEDMAKWDLGLRNESILTRAALDQMWAATRLNDGTTSSYGFGWGIAGEAPHRAVLHSGGHMTGFSTHIVRFLDDDLSVIVLLNARHGDPAKIARGVASCYVPELKPKERPAIEDKEPNVTELLKRIEGMVRSQKLDDAIFTDELANLLRQSLGETAEGLRAAGKLQATELLERKENPPSGRLYRYRMRFENAVFYVRLDFNQVGKVSGLQVESD